MRGGGDRPLNRFMAPAMNETNFFLLLFGRSQQQQQKKLIETIKLFCFKFN